MTKDIFFVNISKTREVLCGCNVRNCCKVLCLGKSSALFFVDLHAAAANVNFAAGEDLDTAECIAIAKNHGRNGLIAGVLDCIEIECNEKHSFF